MKRGLVKWFRVLHSKFLLTENYDFGGIFSQAALAFYVHLIIEEMFLKLDHARACISMANMNHAGQIYCRIETGERGGHYAK